MRGSIRTVVGFRSDKRARQASRHTRAPTPAVWFASWRQLAGLLSDENLALLRLMQENEPLTVLAGLCGRAASNLSPTLRNLEGDGLVKLHRGSHIRAVRQGALATGFLVVLD